MQSKTVFLAVFFTVLHQSAAWNYRLGDPLGPANWAVEYNTCKGERQSPVNIKTTECFKMDYEELKFNDNYTIDTASQYKLKNMNKTLKVEFSKNVGDKIMSGGGLPAEYVLAGFHMHWGKSDTEGSEHYVDNGTYAMEIHLVHAAKGTVKDGDQYAALGIFVKVGAKNDYLEPIVSRLSKVPYEGDYTDLDEKFDPTKMFPKNRNDFFRYEGGLTTPNCDEHVVWTIFREPITMSTVQLKAFRSMFFNAKGDSNETMQGNHRPLQEIGARKIYKSFSGSTTIAASLLIVVATVLAHFF